MKSVRSEEYNYLFNKENGEFIRWGRTLQDDAVMSPFGPEILDIEISTVCSNGCSFCYKSNTCQGRNMSFETFEKLFAKFPKNLTQIAFGIGDIDANPDIWKIFAYCREHDVVPNVTINGNRMTLESYDNLAKYCGAVAVSLYNKDVCYSAVQELVNRGMKQVNIHSLLSNETYARCWDVVHDKKSDPRLKGMNAIVFLWLKPKGIRNTFTPLTNITDLKKLIEFALKSDVSFGFDSCSAPNVLRIVAEDPKLKFMEKMIEPCESTLFSYYINVDGIGYPCSFAEGLVAPVDVLKEDFWSAATTTEFRRKLLKECRCCPLYKLGCVE